VKTKTPKGDLLSFQVHESERTARQEVTEWRDRYPRDVTAQMLPRTVSADGASDRVWVVVVRRRLPAPAPVQSPRKTPPEKSAIFSESGFGPDVGIRP